MKKRAMAMLLAGILAAMTAACGQAAGESTAPAEESISVEESIPGEESIPAETGAASGTESTITETVAESLPEETAQSESSTSAENEAGYEDNFAVDSAAAAEFGKKVKEAVNAQDLEALADLTAYPVYVGFEGESATPASKEEFLALGAEKIFTPEFVESVGNADETALSPSMAGFVLSTGDGPNVIFGVVNGALAIQGINY